MKRSDANAMRLDTIKRTPRSNWNGRWCVRSTRQPRVGSTATDVASAWNA
jgi:hypothetical protein